MILPVVITPAREGITVNSELVALAPLPAKAKYSPVFVLYALNTLVAALVTWGLPLTTTQTAAISTIATAVLGLVAAFAVHPFPIPAATAAISTVLVAAAAFGFHLGQDKITALVGVVSLVAAYITHQLVTPQAAIKAGLRQGA